MGRRCATRVGGFVAAVGAGALAFPSASGAYYAPLDGAPGFADNSEHTYISIESDPAFRARWDKVFDDEIGQWADKTDLVANELTTYTHTTDLYWYLQNDFNTFWDQFPADYIAVTTCQEWTNFIQVCERHRVVVKDSVNYESSGVWKNLACHETGHTIGFSHGTNHTSCMDGGDNALVGTSEINQVNYMY